MTGGNKQEPAIQQSKVTWHEGPLPDPETFQQYNSVLPDAAERIMEIYESEVRHRHAMDAKQVELHRQHNETERLKVEIEMQYAAMESRNSLAGIVSATLLSLLVIGGGMYMIINTEHDILGAAFTSSGLAALVGAFVQGTRIHSRQAE